jgi:hypothetical protein
MIEVLELGKDFVRARVESRSQPGTFHTVEVTRYGAVCDCLGTLHLKKKDMCVHAESVLAFLKENHGLTFALDREKIEASYLVKTGSFIDVFGGLLAGEPTLFYGPDGSGKTLSTLTIVARYSSIQNSRIIYVNTETGDPQNRYAKNTIARFGGNLDRIDFYAFAEESKLHAFLGGRGEGGEKAETLKDVLKKGEIGLVAIDSVSRFYNAQINNVPPQQRPQVASQYVGKLGVWIRFMQEIMFRQQKPFPIILTAWMRSGVGKVLQKDVEKDVAELANPQQEKEWTGPKAIGYWSKAIYRVEPAGVRRVKFTQIRGELMMKSVVCDITERGVELAEGN